MEQIVATHEARLVRLLTRILGDSHAARDAAQDTWYAIFQARERLLEGVDPWPYIRTTGVRKAIDLLRGLSRGVPLTIVADRIEQHPAPSLRDDALDLEGLSPEERACLTLYFVEGCSVNEISRQLHAPEGTVKSWMFRGREKLRQRLRAKGPTP